MKMPTAIVDMYKLESTEIYLHLVYAIQVWSFVCYSSNKIEHLDLSLTQMTQQMV